MKKGYPRNSLAGMRNRPALPPRLWKSDRPLPLPMRAAAMCSSPGEEGNQRMTASSPRAKNSMRTAVEMAVAAVEDSPLPSPQDQDFSGVDPDPTSLDLVLPDNRDNQHDAESGGSWRGQRAVLATEETPCRSVLESRDGSRFQPGRRWIHDSVRLASAEGSTSLLTTFAGLLG